MTIKQHPITAEHLDTLEAICRVLDTMQNHANRFSAHRPYLCGVHYQDIRRNVIFWSPGYGWRLHITWYEALAAKRARLEPQSDHR